MKRCKGVFIISIGLILGLSACSGVHDESTEAASEETINEALAAEGEKIVNSSCTGCHGIDLSGDLGPNLHNLSLSKDQIIEILIKGRKSMPPGTANGKEEEVAEYLLTLK